ncbi:MAG: sugar transferase [Kiritimatiellae bacterium]|nr:sugar transferase [Kiritimatiellia bacterium]
MKRFVETLIVILTAPLWLTAMATVAIAVAICDGRPIFFSQERAGLGGRIFRLWKFRTMRPGEGTDAERTTKLGRFLRAASLDELPQLFQVVTGDMSLVGPRPLPVRYLPRYSTFQARRHEVRPGITGWAQVNGRNAISWERKFELDVWYVDRRSLLLDAKILFLTMIAVFARSGVNASKTETMEEFRGQMSER